VPDDRLQFKIILVVHEHIAENFVHALLKRFAVNDGGSGKIGVDDRSLSMDIEMDG
jgi:hypothetical protein